MKSKWEWIKDACNELGYEEAAGIAGEIETLLKEIYGDTKTVAWMKDYIDVKYGSLVSLILPPDASDIGRIAGSPRYCIACMEDVHCGTCRFAMRGGGCCVGDTLYIRFMNTLHREADII